MHENSKKTLPSLAHKGTVNREHHARGRSAAGAEDGSRPFPFARYLRTFCRSREILNGGGCVWGTREGIVRERGERERGEGLGINIEMTERSPRTPAYYNRKDRVRFCADSAHIIKQAARSYPDIRPNKTIDISSLFPSLYYPLRSILSVNLPD